MKGVINLRGKVIPVGGLGLRFGIEAIGYTERTCIIVVEIRGEARCCRWGPWWMRSQRC
jgi:purine-binding chemotaxis protein CheW